MSRRAKHEEHENHERWLITYSDLITLLMIFFVIMYAMSSVSKAKFTALQQSLAAALHEDTSSPLQNDGKSSLIESASSDNGHNPSTSTTNQSQVKSSQKIDNLAKQVHQYIVSHNLQANVSSLDEQRGIQITLRDVVLFDTGQATLKPGAQDLLEGLVPFFNRVDNPIVIEGYTDNQPIDTPQFPTNWDLSTARATDVVKFLQTQHVAPTRLSAVGYGEFHPLVPNDTAEHRQENRRVNIVIMRSESSPDDLSQTQ